MPKKYTRETFIEKAIIIHGNKYNYDKVIFNGVKKHVILVCDMHGDFKQAPDKHINGKQGCSKCKLSSRKNLNYLIKMGNKIHNNKYDYSKVIFTIMYQKVEIICPQHGSFWQLPANHINHQQGCRKCDRIRSRLTTEEFIQRSLNVHKECTYDYSKTIYITGKTKVEIICPKHGSFWQYPTSHMSGANCPSCAGFISKKEIAWLNYLNVPSEFRNKILRHDNKNYRVDAYDPILNIIYEFYGDYWHGNPNIYHSQYINNHNGKSFIDLYNDTINRENELINLGYKLKTIWENEFDKLQIKVK